MLRENGTYLSFFDSLVPKFVGYLPGTSSPRLPICLEIVIMAMVFPPPTDLDFFDHNNEWDPQKSMRA